MTEEEKRHMEKVKADYQQTLKKMAEQIRYEELEKALRLLKEANELIDKKEEHKRQGDTHSAYMDEVQINANISVIKDYDFGVALCEDGYYHIDMEQLYA